MIETMEDAAGRRPGRAAGACAAAPVRLPRAGRARQRRRRTTRRWRPRVLINPTVELLGEDAGAALGGLPVDPRPARRGAARRAHPLPRRRCRGPRGGARGQRLSRRRGAARIRPSGRHPLSDAHDRFLACSASPRNWRRAMQQPAGGRAMIAAARTLARTRRRARRAAAARAGAGLDPRRAARRARRYRRRPATTPSCCSPAARPIWSRRSSTSPTGAWQTPPPRRASPRCALPARVRAR